MIATLTDDWQSGVLGDIIVNADQESVRKYNAPGLRREGLPNVPVRPISERLMRALRMEIDDGAIKFNTNGGAAWIKDDSVWLVCKIAVTRIRERLDSEGAIDVPNDERLYDILLDQGNLIPNLEHGRKSIWYVTIACDDYTHHMTMLRFSRSNLIHRSRRIDDFEGQISVISRESLLARRADAKAAARPSPSPAEKKTERPPSTDQNQATPSKHPIDIDTCALDTAAVQITDAHPSDANTRNALDHQGSSAPVQHASASANHSAQRSLPTNNTPSPPLKPKSKRRK